APRKLCANRRMTNQRFATPPNERVRYSGAIANVNLDVLQRLSAFMDKYKIRSIKNTPTTSAHAVSNGRRKQGMFNQNASNVMLQIFVSVRSLISCRSSMRHLVNDSQVFCVACTGQGA